MPIALALAQLGHIASLLPVALDGEAESTSNIGLGVISLASIVVAYMGLFALWYFVFRDKTRSKRKKE